MKNIYIFVGLIAIVVLAGAGWYFVSPLFITNEVNEALPFERATTEQLTPDEILKIDQDYAANTPDTEIVEAMPTEAVAAGPVALRSGAFEDADSFHQGSGTATLYQAGAEQLIRLEDFEVTNGPDLIVVLSKHSAPSNRQDLGTDYLDLGTLKGNVGNQNYTIPANIDISEFKSVVIYCRPFHVVFSTATLN